jgi:hypothetical protein
MRPSVRFHPEVFDDCKQEDNVTVVVENCVKMLYRHVANRTRFLFPAKESRMQDYAFEWVWVPFPFTDSPHRF